MPPKHLARRTGLTRTAGVTCGAALLAALVAHPPASAATVTDVADSADSWVDAANPSVNHGANVRLRVDQSPVLTAYLRFAVPTTTVSHAVLTLTPSRDNPDGLTVRTASNSWTESTITAANAPAPGAVVARSGAVTAGVPVRIDVTGAVPAGGGPVTLVVGNRGSTSYSVHSREAAGGRPVLSVTSDGTSTATASTTTSPTVTATTTTASGSKLTWAPPAMVNPVTYHVSGDGPGTINAPSGQDSVVVWDAPTHRRIRFSGGHNWVIRGGEVNNDKQWSSLDDEAGIQFENATGTAFVEGMYIHGGYGKDGIRVGSGGSNMNLVIENSRIIERLSGPSAYHTDVTQEFGGIKSLKIDHMTGSGDFQGQMFKQETGTTFGPSDFRHVNYRAASPEVQYMINLVEGYATQPVTLSDVWNQPDPSFVGGDFCRAQTPSASAYCGTDAAGNRYVTWSGTPIVVTGRVTQGPPPGGDFVPAGVAGIGYVSPGYL